MAKIQIKSEKLTPFGGIFSIMPQIILYPHFLPLLLRKALHKSLPAGAEASMPMPETGNKRTRIRLILTAHTTICARNILFLHDFYSIGIQISVSNSSGAVVSGSFR